MFEPFGMVRVEGSQPIANLFKKWFEKFATSLRLHIVYYKISYNETHIKMKLHNMYFYVYIHPDDRVSFVFIVIEF